MKIWGDNRSLLEFSYPDLLRIFMAQEGDTFEILGNCALFAEVCWRGDSALVATALEMGGFHALVDVFCGVRFAGLYEGRDHGVEDDGVDYFAALDHGFVRCSSAIAVLSKSLIVD